MGRPERNLDPEAGLIERFAYDLRQLREAAGKPTYRSMAHRAGCAPSTLSEAAKGLRLPTLQTTLDYVRACGVRDTTEWERRWHETHRRLNAEPPAAPPPPPEAKPERPAHAKNLWLAALAIVVAVLVATLVWPSPQQAESSGGDAHCREPFQLTRVPVAIAPCIHSGPDGVEMSVQVTATTTTPDAVAYLWLHDVTAKKPLKTTLRTCPLQPAAGKTTTCGPFVLDTPHGTYTTAATVEPAPARPEPPHWQSGSTGTQSPAITHQQRKR